MTRWIVPVSFAIFLSYSTAWGATVETPNFGKGTSIDLKLFTLPLDENPDCKNVKEKKREGEPANDESKGKKALDRKVDDAIRKALEDK